MENFAGISNIFQKILILKSSVKCVKTTAANYAAIPLILFAVFLFFAPFARPAVSFASDPLTPRVESVTAVVSGENLPKFVKLRMENTVAAVAEQLFLGKAAAAAQESLSENAVVIGAVFDKVLVGYTVTGAECLFDDDDKSAVLVKIALTPWDDVIEDVKVDVAVEGFSETMATLAKRDLADVRAVFAETLLGLPLAAADWANGIVKKQLHEYLQERLPEFRADFDIDLTADRTAAVALVVYPRLPVVRSIDLSMRSDTLPNFWLLNFREKFKKKIAELNGVPVAFVTRHRADLEDYLARSLDAELFLQNLKAKTTVTITGGEYLAIMSRTDSKRANIRLTGWTDIGRNSSPKHGGRRDTVGMFHAGFLPHSQDELFTQIEVYPDDTAAKFSLGWYHALDKDCSVWSDLRYDAEEGGFVYGIFWDLDKRFRMRYEYRQDDRRGEAALRVKLHDFLGVEYAFDKDDQWIRVIGYF